MNWTLWSMFFVVFASTAMVPGPNAAFSVAQSLNYGFRRAFPGAVGFALGTGCHAVVVYSGVGLFAKDHPMVLAALKWGGVGFLVYLAVKALLAKGEQNMVAAQETSVSKMIFGAILVSFTNPKGILASLLIYPAFIDPDLAYVPQAVAYGITGMAISLVAYTCFMLIADRAKALFRSKAAMNKVVGVIYAGVAVALAVRS